MSFYENYKRICKEKGKSTYKTANEIGLSNTIVVLWKQNKRQPNLTTLKKLSNILNVDMNELTEEREERITINKKDFSESEYQQIKAFIKFIVDQRKADNE